MNFSGDDPYWDTPAKLNNIDEDCKKGIIKDLIIIERTNHTVKLYWCGGSPLTTGLGMIEYAKSQLMDQISDS